MVMLALGEVPRCRRVHPELGAALEQHRHVLLRQVQVCGGHLLPQAGALLGPLRVDHQLQPRPPGLPEFVGPNSSFLFPLSGRKSLGRLRLCSSFFFSSTVELAPLPRYRLEVSQADALVENCSASYF